MYPSSADDCEAWFALVERRLSNFSNTSTGTSDQLLSV
jgi:hypothetical protein